MALTPEQEEFRKGRLMASCAPYLMEGNQEEMLREWMRIVGHPAYKPKDLSRNWPVIHGTICEKPALDWYQTETGDELVDRGAQYAHPEFPYIGCTLDSRRTRDNFVLDVKAPGPWRKIIDVQVQYCAQIVVQKACAKAAGGSLLIVHGGQTPEEYPLAWPEEYEREVWKRMQWFWDRCESLQPPCKIPSISAPVPAVKTVDMSRSNRWCDAAGEWLKHRDAATRFNTAAKDIKSLVEDDVLKAHGGGIILSRNKAGALSIKEGRL